MSSVPDNEYPHGNCRIEPVNPSGSHLRFVLRCSWCERLAKKQQAGKGEGELEQILVTESVNSLGRSREVGVPIVTQGIIGEPGHLTLFE